MPPAALRCARLSPLGRSNTQLNYAPLLQKLKQRGQRQGAPGSATVPRIPGLSRPRGIVRRRGRDLTRTRELAAVAGVDRNGIGTARGMCLEPLLARCEGGSGHPRNPPVGSSNTKFSLQAPTQRFRRMGRRQGCDLGIRCPRLPEVPDRPTAPDVPASVPRGGLRPSQPSGVNNFLNKLVPLFLAVGVENRR